MKRKQVGLTLIVLGLLGSAGSALLGEISQRKALESFGRANVGCTYTFQFDRTGTYYIYAESGQSRQIDKKCPITPSGDRLEVVLERESAPVPMVEDANIGYEYRGASGRSIRQFVVDSAGLYDLTVTGPNESEVVAIGTDPTQVRRPWMMAAGMLAAAGVIGGLVLLLWGRRRSSTTASDDVAADLGSAASIRTPTPYLPRQAVDEVRRRQQVAQLGDRSTPDTSSMPAAVGTASTISIPITDQHERPSGSSQEEIINRSLAGLANLTEAHDRSIAAAASEPSTANGVPFDPATDATPAGPGRPFVSSGASQREEARGPRRRSGRGRGIEDDTVDRQPLAGTGPDGSGPRRPQSDLAARQPGEPQVQTVGDAIDFDDVLPPSIAARRAQGGGYRRREPFDRDGRARATPRRRDETGRYRGGYDREDFAGEDFAGDDFAGDYYVDRPIRGRPADDDFSGHDDFDDGYIDDGYVDARYVDDGYVDDGYVDDGYVDARYVDDGYVDDGYGDGVGQQGYRSRRDRLVETPRPRALRRSRRVETELPSRGPTPRRRPGPDVGAARARQDGYFDERSIDDRQRNGTERPPVRYQDPAFDAHWDVPSRRTSPSTSNRPTSRGAPPLGKSVPPQPGGFPPPPPPESLAGIPLDDQALDYSGELYPQDWDQPATGELQRPPEPSPGGPQQVQDEWHANGDNTGSYRWWSPPDDARR